MKNLRIVNKAAILCTSSLFLFSMQSANAAGRDSYSVQQQKISQVKELVSQTLQAAHITGASLAVVHNDEPLMLEGFGMAGVDKPVTPSTAFRLASISKTFTTFAMMKLVNQGKIDLDESVYHYLPNFNPIVLPGNKKDLLVKDLLSHNNGLPTGWIPESFPPQDQETGLTNLVASLNGAHLTWDRDEILAYDNIAFAVVGEIVATVSGKTWPEFLRSEVFTPLDMTNALPYLPYAIPENVSNGYIYGQQIALPHISNQPAGTVIASANDMSKYMQAILNDWTYDSHAILPRPLLEEMATATNVNRKYQLDKHMGLGFFFDDLGGELVLEHAGDLLAFHTAMRIVPNEKFAVYIGANDFAGTQVMRDLSEQIVDIWLPHLAGDDVVEPLAPATANLQAGLYSTGKQWMNISQNTNGTFQFDGQYEGQAVSAAMNVDANGYYAVDGIAGLLIKPINQGNDLELFVNGKQTEFGLKVESTGYNENVDAFIGQYQAVVQNFLVNVINIEFNQEHQVYMINRGEYSTPAKVIDDNRLQVIGVGRDLGMVVTLAAPGMVIYEGLPFQLVAAQ